MNLKDLNVEKVALALLIIFVFVLFIDYTFNISILISKFYQLDIDTEQRRKLLTLVSISIVPILQFLSKCSFDRKSNNEPDILVNSISPFLAFIIGFYLLKIDFFSSVEGLFLIMFIQLILLLTVLTTLQLLLSKVIIWYSDFNVTLRLCTSK